MDLCQPTLSSPAYCYLSGKDVTAVMRWACQLAYPDPKHFMREHITSLVAHSNRVTAAVVLKSLGWSEYDITIRLRWEPESVKAYIRECCTDIGRLTISAIQGSMQLK
jgi:hypothetical protein